jgi:hypothetical protein
MANKTIRHLTFVGIAKSNYFIGRAPSLYGQLHQIVDNTMPAYSFGYEGLCRITNKFYIGLGLGLTNARTRLTFTSFVTPNILSGVISAEVRHSYASIPLNAYWRVPISTISSVYFHLGVESFKSLSYSQIGKEVASIYKNDGTADKNYKFSLQLQKETFSLFRTFNAGLKFSLNENSKNRAMFGINYYLMRNDFPLVNNTIINVGNKNFLINNRLNFEGLKFTLGYLW